MRPRQQRVLVPETIFEQRVGMAIERGRLADLIFDDPGKLSHRALALIMNTLEKSRPVKAVMAIETVKSAFLASVVKQAQKRSAHLNL